MSICECPVKSKHRCPVKSKHRAKAPIVPTLEEIENMVERLDKIPDILCSIAAATWPEGACACCYSGSLLDTSMGCQ